MKLTRFGKKNMKVFSDDILINIKIKIMYEQIIKSNKIFMKFVKYKINR